jgi:Eukaryotic integral membrane protein (DUF1751)
MPADAPFTEQHPVTFVLIGVLIVIYFVGLALGTDAPNKLGLATGSTLIVNTYVWNVLTSCFFETQILKVSIDIAALLAVARGMEVSGGLDQFALYLVFSVLACTIGTSAYCFLRFFATGLEEMLMEPIYGFSGVFMAVLVYARRQHKGAPIHYTVPQITFQNLPLLVILGQTLLRVFGLTVFALDIPFSIISLLFCWSYLRFFYRFDEMGTSPLGDKSEEFAFIAMFPEPLHVVAVPLTTAFYNLMAMFGIFPELEVVVERKPQHHLYQTSAGGKLPPDSPLIAPMRQDVVMERRRAKALKLLEMAEQNSSHEGNNWDVEEEAGGGGSGGQSLASTTLKV